MPAKKRDHDKHSLDELLRCPWIVQCDVVGDGIEIIKAQAQSRLFQPSRHATPGLSVRHGPAVPYAVSPRAMPSSKLVRRCSASYVSTSTR
jgi:hypothetical protein